MVFSQNLIHVLQAADEVHRLDLSMLQIPGGYYLWLSLVDRVLVMRLLPAHAETSLRNSMEKSCNEEINKIIIEVSVINDFKAASKLIDITLNRKRKIQVFFFFIPFLFLSKFNV